MVILRIVIDVSGDVLFLDTTDAMFESWCSRERIRSRQCFGVASVRHERRRIVGKVHFDLRQLVHPRDGPGFGTVCEIAVRQIKHWRHVLERESYRFDRHVETVGGRRWSDNDRRTLAVSSPNSLEQIGLFRFGWQ